MNLVETSTELNGSFFCSLRKEAVAVAKRCFRKTQLFEQSEF
jgi:hypothetical protein